MTHRVEMGKNPKFSFGFGSVLGQTWVLIRFVLAGFWFFRISSIYSSSKQGNWTNESMTSKKQSSEGCDWRRWQYGSIDTHCKCSSELNWTEHDYYSRTELAADWSETLRNKLTKRQQQQPSNTWSATKMQHDDDRAHWHTVCTDWIETTTGTLARVHTSAKLCIRGIAPNN